MTPDAQTLYALIREVRTGFNRLKGIADAIGDDLGVNASMRAVLEALAEGGEQTVPAIARSKGVSRQHIQVIMDGLAADGLAAPRPNPAHRRSPLFALTQPGRERFDTIRRREAAVLERLAAALDMADIAAGRQALAALNRELSHEED